MLRADLLDAMDYMMQTVRKKATPLEEFKFYILEIYYSFHGRDEEWRTLQNYYKGNFSSLACCSNCTALYIELSKIYRQTDTDFISVLNN
jgi:hypothetical protein